MLRIVCVVLVACGSGSPPAKPAAPSAPPPPVHDDRAERERAEQAKHDELAAAHRKLEEEQQDALAATCTESPQPSQSMAAKQPHERCLPSCYTTEPADPRAGKKLVGAVEIQHVACEKPGEGAYVIVDELDVKLAVRAVRGRFPAGHKKGSWQATVEAALREVPKLPRGDALVVASGWRDRTHPLTKDKLRCVTVSHYTHVKHPLDKCAGDGGIACEAAGNPTARAINVVHYRLAEAHQLQAAGKTEDCQQAALEAIAVARGLPRWRQYKKLNVGQWAPHAAYRTRFDGILDEDALFAAAASLGTEAEAMYTACGGAAGAQTTPAQEQSFHTCW